MSTTRSTIDYYDGKSERRHWGIAAYLEWILKKKEKNMNRDGKTLNGEGLVWRKDITFGEVYKTWILGAPKGYKFTGEFRVPAEGEYYFGTNGIVFFACKSDKEPRAIVVQEKKKRFVFTFDRHGQPRPGEYYQYDNNFYCVRGPVLPSMGDYDIYKMTEEEV